MVCHWIHSSRFSFLSELLPGATAGGESVQKAEGYGQKETWVIQKYAQN